MYINSQVIEASTARLERKHSDRMILARAAAAPPLGLKDRVRSYINERRVPDDIGALERAMGTNDLLSVNYFWAGLRAARSVGRIVIAPGPGEPGGSATGFMISPHLMITNWHVFETAEIPRRARIQFAYEADASGNERIATWFSLDPGRFFVTHERLDYAVVYVDADSKQGPEPLSNFGWLRMNERLGKTDYGQYLSLVEHPGGQTKQIAIRENKLFPFDDTDDFLTYQSDTFRGSSGSPVFNDFWDVVALHHAGKPLKDAAGRYIGHDGNPIVDRKPQEHEIKWVANEGARVSRIVADLLARAPATEVKAALEAAMAGTLKPTMPPLESELMVPSSGTLVVRSSDPGVAPPEKGFVLTLPLNVSVRVESLTQPPVDSARVPPPSAAQTTTPRPPISSPAVIAFERFNFDRDYASRSGYDERYLGAERKVAMPKIATSSASKIAPLKDGGGKLLHYHHFSIMMHKDRRMPVLSAGNVDYRTTANVRDDRSRADFGSEQWILDERMEDRFQIPQGFYDRWRRLDFGHLVRREDNCWGANAQEIEFANADTYHLTNCTPQHEDFNQASHRGIWGRLEVLIGKQAERDTTISRLCVLAGPIFGEHDLQCPDSRIGTILVPLAFWKVIVAPTQRGPLRAYGFILSQAEPLAADAPFEDFVPTGFTQQQKKLSEIEAKTIVRFDNALKAVDVLNDPPPDGNELAPFESLEGLWLGRP